MSEGNLLYKGKAKSVFAADDSNVLSVVFRDDITALDGLKKNTFEGKGACNAKVTAYFYPILEKNGVPTHFIKSVNETTQLVRKLKMIPLEVVVRNRAAGSLVRNYGFTEGQYLEKPIIVMDLKDDSRHDPMINDDIILALKFVTETELAEIKRLALLVNKILKENLAEKNIDLIDMKLEFGKDNEGLIRLGDEISMDSLRLWDKGEICASMDKDIYRKDKGDVMEVYRKTVERIVN
ncbi:MAG: phosphoribosylaminoimidazolesuccinocarboxamide synthase [Methanocorpusculum sp.]|nr:phosphoribosylaminoimidazolesuccinocarboxamide synthase [Methanocorpusculum sp.]